MNRIIHNRAFISNILLAVGIQLMYHLFSMDKGSTILETNYLKGLFLLIVILVWLLGLFYPNPTQINEKLFSNYFWLSFIGSIGNGYILVSIFQYFGFHNKESMISYIIFPIVIMGFFEVSLYTQNPKFLNKLIYNHIDNKSNGIGTIKYNNIFLEIYTVLGFSYVFNIVLYIHNFSKENFWEILGVFIFIGLPFYRYRFMDTYLHATKNWRAKLYLIGSYLFVFLSAIYRYLS